MQTIRLTILIGSLLLSLNLHAQIKNSSVSGIVADRSTGQAIEFATIQLINPADSSIVKATVTDKKGRFILEHIAAGEYSLHCTFIGYERSIKTILINNDQHKLQLGTILIASFSATLKEVTVTSKKSLLNTSIDRKVYNVAEDLLSQTGSASDILKNIPSVEVDIEGQVSLRGSSDVMILINGRPSPLMGRSRAEALQQLPANSIERIEVITNPSARYRPDGTSGIINIVLKKNTKAGFNGNITANAGNRNRYSGNINMNYKPGKLNLFGNYSIRKDQRTRINTIDRTYFDSAGAISGFYIEDNKSPGRPLSHFATFGADYSFNAHNSFGISANYSTRKMIKHDVIQKFFYDKNKTLTAHSNRLRFDPESEIEKEGTLYFQHNFSKEDHELRFEINASEDDGEEDNRYTNKYHYPIAPPSFDNTLIKQGDNQQQIALDYTNPLTEDSKLELGYAGLFMQQDLNFFGEYYDQASGKFVKDDVKSNRFLYKDFNHAVYGTFQRSYEKFGYSAGLRLEHVNLKGHLVTIDSFITNHYFKIYPTLHLSYKLKNTEVQLNYSRRVNRPEGDELNPYPEYRDPYNLQAGNPKLLPEMIHSVEMGLKGQHKKISFVPSIYYRFKEQGFTTVINKLNDSVLLTTISNLGKDQSAGFELIVSARAGKFMSSNFTTNIFYNQIDASEPGYSNKKSIISMSANFNATFTITSATMFQLSGNYRSARLTPQGKVYGNLVVNIGVRQDLFKKKVSVILTASDLLNSLKQKTELNTSFLKQTAIGRRDTRIIYLGVSYRFGKMIKKSEEEKLQFDNSL